MKRLSFFVTVITSLALAATLTLADDVETRHRFKLKVGGDGEVITIDDLEVGETRQLFTDSGKEVIVTREEDGIKLTVDGKEIDVSTPHHPRGLALVDVGGEDGEHVNVIVKKIGGHGEGEEGEHVMVWHGDAGGHAAHDVMVWTGEEGEDHVLAGGEGHGFAFVAAPDVAGSVLESGVLDDLDPAKREEILKAIKDAAVTRTFHKKVRVHAEGDHEEH
jgi:hypothetical protein